MSPAWHAHRFKVLFQVELVGQQPSCCQGFASHGPGVVVGAIDVEDGGGVVEVVVGIGVVVGGGGGGRQTPCPLQFAKPQAPICIKTPLHVGMLPRPTLSGVAVEYDIMPDMLPTRSPTVIRNRRLLPVPDATMQAIDTSDLHSVASHDERPARSPAVCHIPKLAPVTVKLTDPVDPVLIDETFG
jgi:hypothetical protein